MALPRRKWYPRRSATAQAQHERRRFAGRWAREKPFAAAIVDRTRLIDFRSLDGAVWRTAALLSAEGLQPGHRIGLSLPDNSIFSPVVAYALARLGAPWMLMPTTDPPAARLALAQRFGLAAVIGEDAVRLDGVRLIRPRWTGSFRVSQGGARRAATRRSASDCRPAPPAGRKRWRGPIATRSANGRPAARSSARPDGS